MDSSSSVPALELRDKANLIDNSGDSDVVELTRDVTAESARPEPGLRKRTKRFWFTLVTLVLSSFMVILETNIIGTAAPTIADDLKISQFLWIGNTYFLASTALMPLCGGLAEIFGRRPVMLASLFIFGVGGAVSGAANGEGMFFTGRTIMGLGAGGVLTMSSVIVSDLVSLKERGLYNGVLGLAWCAALGMGPVVGGAFAEKGHWRWMFYMNVPFAGVAAFLVVLLVKLPTPRGSLRSKMERIDWTGSFIILGSSTSIVIALTWGGVQYSWSSYQVLVPLILGLAGLVGFMLWEAFGATHPLVPLILVSNRTSLSGYLQALILTMPLAGMLGYLPVYYQACKLASPIASGVDTFGLAFTVAPFSILVGVAITITKRYRPPIWLGWSLLMLGQGLLSTVKSDTSRSTSIGYQVIIGAGIGLVFTSAYFPILSPLPVSANAAALSFYLFLRTFGQIWGFAIGGTILQNRLTNHMPTTFYNQFPEGVAVAYAAIPRIAGLSEPLRGEVQSAFADALIVVWHAHLIMGAIGLAVSLAMRGLPLHDQTDEKWDAEQQNIA